MLTRRQTLTLTLAAAAIAMPTTPALAREPKVFSARRGRLSLSPDYAIRGTDPVAYFTAGEPVEGQEAFQLEWEGATWLFASAQNRDIFRADPLAHAPQFGGYCAWAAAQGYIAPTVPEAWSLVGGKLYLNASLRIRTRWERDTETLIPQAEANWPGILG